MIINVKLGAKTEKDGTLSFTIGKTSNTIRDIGIKTRFTETVNGEKI